jgi:hypothetical protein
MCGTLTTFEVRVQLKWVIFGDSIRSPNRDLRLVAGLKLYRMSRSTLSRRNPGHHAQLRSEMSISLQTTNIKDTFLQVLVDESIRSSKGRVEGLYSGAAHR